MNRLVVATLILLASLCGACSDACETLVAETCARHGEDSSTCVARTQELESRSAAQDRLCERALMMVRSLSENVPE
jgi:hypothetical protein